MSWDRVIQDSDEDEPLVEDGIPPSIGLPPGDGSLDQPDHDTPADNQTRFIAEPTTVQHTSTEPQLGVNFDQFLQSQEGQLAPATLSQQQREERWIPSTSEGGGGSIGAGAGAMMTEIGLAQQRLVDDDTSSAGQRLPSTTTPYSSEISQPGSFPAIPTYQYQQGGISNDEFIPARPVHEAPYEATQLVAPVQSHVYDYSTPAASTHVASPMAGSELPPTNPTSIQQTDDARGYTSQKTSQRCKSMQSVPYSPHDTEPLSSLASPRLSRTKSDNARLEPMSPRSPADTHDELSLPAVAVEISTVKKKRGRPKKQSIPEDDEDDELAAPQKGGSVRAKDEEKQPRDPSNSTTNVPVVTDDKVAADARQNPSRKESKKKKVKRSRTADAVMQKANISASDDDVIWVDSRPIQTENLKQNGQNSTLLENDTNAPPQPEEPTDPNANTENHADRVKPAPKKRGRKRKQTTESQLTKGSETDPQASKENQPPKEPEPETEPNPSTTLPDQEQQPSITTATTTEEPTKSTSTPDPTSRPPSKPATEEQEHQPPQTPQRTETEVTNQDPNTSARTTKKGPGQHSPISSTSKVPYRVGLSKRARIAPLLKVVRK